MKTFKSAFEIKWPLVRGAHYGSTVRARDWTKEGNSKEEKKYIYRRKLGLSDSTKENNDYVRELYRKRNSFWTIENWI